MPDTSQDNDLPGAQATATLSRGPRLQDHTRLVPRWEKSAVAALIALAAFLDGIGLSQNGFGNLYYAATVRSMMTNWHNFFFAAFDPAGFVTVDKPPLGFWIQVLSAKILGFHAISLILPQALAGVISVFVLYMLVRRTFGAPAGLLAGALLTLSPVNVVANRSNILESLVVLSALLGAWAVIRAAETGQFSWLTAGAVLIGFGFMTKMLEAYLVVPALALVYLIGSPGTWRARWRQLILAGVILAGVSLAWPVAVDQVPATQRPWVDSTFTNSELDLIVNYNGLQRVFGQPHYGNNTPHPTVGTGQPGLLRLAQPELGGQVSWFLPLALAGLLSSIWEVFPVTSGVLQNSRRWRDFARPRAWAFWVTWLVSAGLFFSAGQFFNRYYLVMLAPAVCALAAIGAIGMWRDYRGNGWRRWLLPGAVLATGVGQSVILAGYRAWHPWLLPAVLVATCVSAALLIAPLVRERLPEFAASRVWTGGSISHAASSLALASLLIAPLLWLSASFSPANEGGFPASGPVSPEQTGANIPPADPRLIAYLEARASHRPFLLATRKAEVAAPIILATGAPVMALGGFSGYDPILSTQRLASMVAHGDVRFFLLPISNLSAEQAKVLYPGTAETFATSYSNSLTKWVSQTCQPVPPEQWKTVATPGPDQLFDCDTRGSP